MYPGTKYAHDVNFDNKIFLGALLWNPTLDCYEQHTKTLYKTLTCKNHKKHILENNLTEYSTSQTRLKWCYRK